MFAHPTVRRGDFVVGPFGGSSSNDHVTAYLAIEDERADDCLRAVRVIAFVLSSPEALSYLTTLFVANLDDGWIVLRSPAAEGPPEAR